MTENRYMAIWHNFRNHTCSQEERMYEDTLQELMPVQESHRTPCLERSSCPCQERAALFLQTESRAGGFNHLLNCFQGPKRLGRCARDVLPHSLPCLGPAEALKEFPLFPLPQPLGEVLADGQEGVGSVLGIADNLVKPSHFLV